MADDQTDATTDGDGDGDTPAPAPKTRRRKAAQKLPFSGYVEPNGSVTITLGDAPAWTDVNVTVGLSRLKSDLVELMGEHDYELGF